MSTELNKSDVKAPKSSQADNPATQAAIETDLIGTVAITVDNADMYGELLGTYQIFGYNPYDPDQVGKKVADGITKSGELAVPGETCAMYRDVPFGTMVYIEGLGTYRVNDRGVGSGKVDIAAATNAECYEITRRARVWVLSDGG
jgi:3D (Asp-Asp-Asp) domain-containing protein